MCLICIVSSVVLYTLLLIQYLSLWLIYNCPNIVSLQCICINIALCRYSYIYKFKIVHCSESGKQNFYYLSNFTAVNEYKLSNVAGDCSCTCNAKPAPAMKKSAPAMKHLNLRLHLLCYLNLKLTQYLPLHMNLALVLHHCTACSCPCFCNHVHASLRPLL